MECKFAPDLKILMLPWLAYGHISPFLELAKELSSRNCQTHLCSTPVNLDSIRDKIPGKFSTSVHLVDFHLPHLPELPPEYHTTNGLPLDLNDTLRQALDSSKDEFSRILEDLKPDMVIHDIMIQWVAGVASRYRVPAVPLLTSGAMMCSYFCHSLMRAEGVEYPFPEIRLTGVEWDMVNGYVETQKRKMRERKPDTEPDQGSKPLMTLIASSRGIEGKYIDYLSKLMGWKIVPVRALVCHDYGPENDQTCHELMEWLEKKEKYSTVFLSFGSEYFLKREDIEEIAHGLELSQANFIWVIRFPAGEEVRVEEVLPEGFLERVGERGRIVEKWAPQRRILANQSVGGFVSHCGWNSLMESIEFGVPIIAMPMHLDQPLNGKLVVAMGVGVGVGKDEKGRVERGDIGTVISDVLNGKTGKILRGKVGEVGELLRRKSKDEINEFVQEVGRLCGRTVLHGFDALA